MIVLLLICNGCAVSDNEITLPKCTDPNAIMDLQKELNLYHYIMKYNSDSWNCVDFTTACFQFLDKLGYDVKIMASYPKNANTGHCYPIVKIKNTWVAIEVSLYSSTAIGCVVSGGKYQYLTGYLFNNSTELNEMDVGPDAVYTGDLTRFIAKN